jgi:hypothetical protein
MLLTTRESARWRRWTLGLFVLTSAAYLVYQAREFPHGGSWPGIAFGVLALALVALLLYYGVRKRSYKSRFGTLESWLQSHVYLGLLSLVVVLYHAGFRFEDRVATAALVVLAAVVVTGLYGAILYTVVPRLLTEVQGEDTPEGLSDELERIARSMRRMAKDRSSTFRRLQEGLLAETRPGRLAGWRLLFARRREREAEPDWAPLLGRVGPEEQEDLRALLVLARQHKELHRRLTGQQKYRNLLDVWLWLHVPLSLALAVLVLAHLGAVFYYWGVLPG